MKVTTCATWGVWQTRQQSVEVEGRGGDDALPVLARPRWRARPGLDALRDAVRDGGVEVLGILAPDRPARNRACRALLLEQFRRAGCAVAFLGRAISDNPGDQLPPQFQGTVAEHERALPSGRFRRGKLQKARAG